jgi:hypothetical protein
MMPNARGRWPAAIEWLIGSESINFGMFAFAALLLGCVFVAAIAFGAAPQQWVWNLTATVAGAGGGWAIGTIFSPHGRTEAEQFSGWSKGITTFISGYLLANVKDLAKGVEDHGAGQPWVGGPQMFALASFLIVASYVFAIRWRTRPGRYQVIGVKAGGGAFTWEGDAETGNGALGRAASAGMDPAQPSQVAVM